MVPYFKFTQNMSLLSVKKNLQTATQNIIKPEVMRRFELSKQFKLEQNGGNWNATDSHI